MDVRRIAIGTALVSLLATGTAAADTRYRGYEYGRVVEVEPIVRRVVVERPRRECWEEVEYRSADGLRIAGTTLAGGVIGAAVGRQLGDGSGRDALTVLGALAGSAVANERARRRSTGALVAVPVERCATTVDRVSERRVDGYWVTYRHRGRLHRIRTSEHPGDRIRLQVTARPAGYRARYGAPY